MNERVMFQTKDEVLIVGDWRSAENPKGAALLLHMMPADRHSWRELQDELAKRQISSLAIDLRGHGESTKKGLGSIDFTDFTDVEHQESEMDVDAALRFLQKKGFGTNRVALVGASIGANLALQAAVKYSDIPAVVLLSPGENYRGITTYGPAAELEPNQSLLTSGSAGDDQRSYDAAEKIVELAKSKEKRFIPLTSAGHGTNMFTQHKDFPAAIASWLEDQFVKQPV